VSGMVVEKAMPLPAVRRIRSSLNYRIYYAGAEQTMSPLASRRETLAPEPRAKWGADDMDARPRRSRPYARTRAKLAY
jgi:hypothetical protein